MSGHDLVVRRIRPDEGDRLREIRLAALADSPGAFASRLEDEAARPRDEWSRRAAEGAAAGGTAWFVADAGRWVGLAGGYRRDDVVNLISMWVAPEARGRGLGARLVEAVVDWARETAAARVELWVATANEPARRLYERMGFEVTGDHQPLPSDPCQDETRMRLDLA